MQFFTEVQVQVTQKGSIGATPKQMALRPPQQSYCIAENSCPSMPLHTYAAAGSQEYGTQENGERALSACPGARGSASSGHGQRHVCESVRYKSRLMQCDAFNKHFLSVVFTRWVRSEGNVCLLV